MENPQHPALEFSTQPCLGFYTPSPANLSPMIRLFAHDHLPCSMTRPAPELSLCFSGSASALEVPVRETGVGNVARNLVLRKPGLRYARRQAIHFGIGSKQSTSGPPSEIWFVLLLAEFLDSHAAPEIGIVSRVGLARASEWMKLRSDRHPRECARSWSYRKTREEHQLRKEWEVRYKVRASWSEDTKFLPKAERFLRA